MQITNDIWLDPNEVSAMVMEKGADNFTLGMNIYLKTGEKFYIRHQSPWVSVFDIQQKIVSYRSNLPHDPDAGGRHFSNPNKGDGKTYNEASG